MEHNNSIDENELPVKCGNCKFIFKVYEDALTYTGSIYDPVSCPYCDNDLIDI